ncbi:cell division protein FtsZ, partial [Enterobacter kobei]
KTYRASANVEKGLYAFNIFEKTIIKSDSVVVLLNERGEPMVH